MELKRKPLDDKRDVVLVKRAGEYVVFLYNKEYRGYYDGYVFDTLEAAERCFENR